MDFSNPRLYNPAFGTNRQRIYRQKIVFATLIGEAARFENPTAPENLIGPDSSATLSTERWIHLYWRAAETRRSRRFRVDSEQRVPAPKDPFQFVIQDRGPCLEQEMRPASRPVQQQLLHKTPAHYVVDRRLDERCADRLPCR